MTTIETKYSIGDTVYWATTVRTQKAHPCPDCKGEKEWKVISPAGTEYRFSCPRCSQSFMNDHDLSLAYYSFEQATKKLTIGSIEYRSRLSYDGDSQTKYMCLETGVGSGSVYSEDDLFLTEEEALAKATVQAQLQFTTLPAFVQQYNKSLRIRDYQLSDAKINLANEKLAKARNLLYNFNDLENTIADCINVEDAKVAINDYAKFYLESDILKAKEAENV